MPYPKPPKNLELGASSAVTGEPIPRDAQPPPPPPPPPADAAPTPQPVGTALGRQGAEGGRHRRGKKSRKTRKPRRKPRRTTRRRRGGDQSARAARVAAMMKPKSTPSSTPEFDKRVESAAERNLGFPSAQRGVNPARDLLNQERDAKAVIDNTTPFSEKEAQTLGVARYLKDDAKYKMRLNYGSREGAKSAAEAQEAKENTVQYLNPMFGRSRRRHRSKRHTRRR